MKFLQFSVDIHNIPLFVLESLTVIIAVVLEYKIRQNMQRKESDANNASKKDSGAEVKEKVGEFVTVVRLPPKMEFTNKDGFVAKWGLEKKEISEFRRFSFDFSKNIH